MSSVTLQEKIARIFLVKPEESRVVIYNLVLFVFLGVGLALGRGTADALFFKRYGIEHLPWVYVLSALSLAASCTLYAAFADRLSSERFFKYILGVLSVALLLVWALMQFPDNDWSYPLYYVVYEVASELILIHAGLYLNQNLNALQAKRLVPLIFGGSQVGVILGGVMLAVLSPLIGVSNILLIWLLASVTSIVMLGRWHHRWGVSPFYRAARKRKLSVSDSMSDVFQGVRFMKQSSLLRMASFSLFFMVIMFYVLIYSVNQIYTETFKTEESLSSFFGILVAVNSLIALTLQFFVANRLLRKFGVRTVNLFFPFTSLFSYLMLLVSFTLPSALIGSFNKDVVMTAFRNPVWSLMMNVLPGNIQGRARAMTVAVVIPSALLMAGVLLLAIKALGSPVYVALVGLISAALYLYFSQRMNRVYVAEIISHLKQKLTLPDEDGNMRLQGSDNTILQDLIRGIQHPDDHIYLAYAGSLIKTFPEQATEIIVSRLPAAQSKVRDQVVRLLLPLQSKMLPEILWQLMDGADERFQSTCYFSLIKLRDEKVRQKVPDLLAHEQARFRAVGVMGAFYLDEKDLHETARQVWVELLSSDDYLANMFGLELLDMAEDMPALVDLEKVDVKHAVNNLTAVGDACSCLASLKVSAFLPSEQMGWFKEILMHLSTHVDRSVRIECLHSWMHMDTESALKAIEQALEDAHPEVRELAAELLNKLEADENTQFRSARLVEMGGSPRAQSAVMKSLVTSGSSKRYLSNMAMAKVEEVKQLNEALQVIRQVESQSAQSALSVLSIVLEERLKATIDLALQALQGSEDADVIQAIRMGMQSHEVQYQATACEALQGLTNKDIGRALTEIIEAPDSSKGSCFSGVEQVIDWCRKRNDPWLHQCAQAVQTA
ncbi:MAG: MFS transporter [Gammaproteobacteria bacterium]|nr:MFS transporter [Gammaproteobacteria bacterium]